MSLPGRQETKKPPIEAASSLLRCTSGPSGKFCNAQPRHKHCGQGAVRREWQALSKGCNTAHDACGAALREPLCECDSVLRFLPREGPLLAKRALIRTRTVALNVTELSTWPTRRHPFNPGYPLSQYHAALPPNCKGGEQHHHQKRPFRGMLVCAV